MKIHPGIFGFSCTETEEQTPVTWSKAYRWQATAATVMNCGYTCIETNRSSARIVEVAAFAIPGHPTTTTQQVDVIVVEPAFPLVQRFFRVRILLESRPSSLQRSSEWTRLSGCRLIGLPWWMYRRYLNISTTGSARHPRSSPPGSWPSSLQKQQ